MEYKILSRLETLQKINANHAWVNRDLYRLMFNKDIFVVAYERIKSKPGNMTPGVDMTTLDGFSMESIEEIIGTLRDESFQFSRGRRVYIPKASGGKRPLGIASPKDKIVQEVMRMILETIYDSPYGPSFRECSHGFRRGRGTHTALREVRQKWHGVCWIIEGDIKGCFDNIDHSILIDILRIRISDERFLNLIRKALNAGYLEFNVPVNSIIGTPQGSITSPILANIYLHELDEFVEGTIRPKYERDGKAVVPKGYKRLNGQLTWLRKSYDLKPEPEAKREILRDIRKLKGQMLRQSAYEHGTGPLRIKYVRYADDWMVGVNGPKEVAEAIREEIRTFLQNRLLLTLSLEKTHIRHAKTEEAFFLGTRIKVGNGGKAARVQIITRNGKRFTKRVNGWQPILKAPVMKIVGRLYNRGFCDSKGSPISKAAWSLLDDDQIIRQFNSVLSGYINYYSFAANFGELGFIQYILKFSLAKTLAHKRKITVKQVFQKYGGNLKAKVEREGQVIQVPFAQVRSWRTDTHRFMIAKDGTQPDGIINTYSRLRVRSKLGACCCICGAAERLQMHHVRHIRKMGQKVTGFAKVMVTLNRKQIPVCKPCHDKVHRGVYDGLSLGSFHDPNLAAA